MASTPDASTAQGMITGFMAVAGLWAWVAVVMLHALFRSIARSDPDPIRPSGPLA